MPCSVANTFVDENGLLFLPAALSRSGGALRGESAIAWYSSRYGFAYNGNMWVTLLAANAAGLNAAYNYSSYVGSSVRLVCLAQ